MVKIHLKYKIKEKDYDLARKNILNLLKALKKAYPNAHCDLNFTTPLELLIATILSAQCTDERVNKVTINLFNRFKKVDDYANSDILEIEQIIRSTGFYRNKAKNIQNSCKMIIEQFNSLVPNQMDKLILLPGVARKTANVVLWNAFGINEGIVVDTHVARTAYRLGLTKNSNPDKIERDLMEIVPREDWGKLSHLLIYLGRDTCKARNPKCGRCKIKEFCPCYKEVFLKEIQKHAQK